MKDRLFKSLERFFQTIPRMSKGMKTGLAAMVFCCLFSQTITAQCNIVCPSSPANEIDLSLGVTGQATLDAIVFEPLVSSSFTQCLPANGGVLEIWEDAGGTISYPTALPGPNFNCTDVGLILVPVYVTLNDLGPGVQSPTCLFIVTIVDNVVPIIFPPGNPPPFSTDPGPSCASVQTLTATVADNCLGNLVLSHVLTGATTGTFPGFTATHAYNEGVTTITWTVEDTGPSPSVFYTSTTTVTVNDMVDPAFVGALPMTTSPTLSANGMCLAVHTFDVPTVSDNCGVSNTGVSEYEMTIDFPAGSPPPHTDMVIDVYPGGFPYGHPDDFPLGTTTITLDVVDDNGRSNSHSFDIIVEDKIGPSFGAAPTNQTVSPAGCTFNASIDMSGFISDNCSSLGGGTITVTHTVNGVPQPGGANASGTYAAGVHTIVFTATDAAGNSTMHTFTLTVNDFVDPEAICKRFTTVQLDGTGSVTVNAMQLDSTSSDNCGIVDTLFRLDAPGGGPFEASKIFDCDDIGDHLIRLRVVDANGNMDTDNTGCILRIEDNVIPNALCQNISVNLAGSPPEVDVYADDGMGPVGSPFINNGSNDNCTAMGDLVIRIRKGTSGPFEPLNSPITFDCSEVGLNTVEIRVRDDEGNVNFCQATVDVNDVEDPVAVATPVNPATLSSTIGAGSVTITPADIEAGSTDNCGITKYEIAESTSGPWFSTTTSPPGVVFDCSDLAVPNPETVYLRVTDGDGNTDITSTTVTIEDADDPTAFCPSTIDVFLDITGNVDVLGSTVGANSTDNCTIVDYEIQKGFFFFGSFISTTGFASLQSFSCNAELGVQPLRLRVRDQSSNLSTVVTCTTAVNIIDNLGPAAGCANLSVPVNTNGEVLVTALQLGLASSDNCTGLLFLTHEMSVDTDGDGNGDTPWSANYLFDCDDILTNDNVVEVRVTDASGNSTICESEVTIEDNVDPVITCPANVTIDCTDDSSPASTGMATATDNCAMPPSVIALPDVISNMVCTGTFRITRIWEAEDDYGNTATCPQIIEVEDNDAPIFAAPADKWLECPDSYDVANFECLTLTEIIVPPLGNITDNVPSTVTSSLQVSVPGTIPVNGKITIVKVSLQIAHTRVDDLMATLQFTPDGAIFPVASSSLFPVSFCPGDQNVDLMLMDGMPSIPCPPVNQSTYFSPITPLSVFNGQFMDGTWELIIDDSDPAPNGGGQLLSWSLDICYIPQAGDLTNTGSVTATDNCDPDPVETPTDYMAFKDFDDNLDFPRPSSDYDFSPAEWTHTTTPVLGGLLDLTNAPDEITLISHDYASPPGGPYENNFEIMVPAMGWVVFDWDYESFNSSPFWDPFGYYIGTSVSFVQLTDDAGGLLQGGRVVVPVMAGQVFGFSQQSVDGFDNPAATTIRNFVYIDKTICPLPADDCPREFCIARLWNVKDDCNNAADPQLQIITTGDKTGPSFGAAPTTMTVIAPSGICTPNVTVDLFSFIHDFGCSDKGNLTLWNSALGDFGTGDGMADASGFYAPGIYTINFKATDECGNMTPHQLILEVIDDQDPDAKCKDFVVQLNNLGEATILLTDLDNGSLDNCPGMLLSFVAPPAAPVSSLLFTTADIGPNPVTLYAFDASGNTSSCVSIVTVLGGVAIDAQDVAGAVGATGIMVPVVTNDEFTDIGSFSVKMEIVDGSVAEIGSDGILIHPDLAALGGFLSFAPIAPVPPGTTEITVSWISPSAFGSTLIPPNTGLFFVKVDLVGAAGTSTPIKVENDVVNRIISGVSTPIPSFGLAGTINVLNPGTDFTVGGPLLTAPICGGVDIELVELELVGAPSIPVSPIPNATGFYSFDVPQGSTVTITPSKNTEWFDGGVDIFDVLLANQHFLGIPPLLNSPYKILAADINRNNSVDIADVFAINQVSLGNLPGGLGDPWGFVNDDHVFTDPFNP